MDLLTRLNMTSFWILILSLTIAIASNIAIGATFGSIQDKFDKNRLLDGVKKGLAVILVLSGVYCIGVLIPDLVRFQVSGITVNVHKLIEIILAAAISKYVFDIFTKLRDIFKINTEIKEVDHIKNIDKEKNKDG